MFGLRRRSKPMLGIDISTSVVKLIELSQSTDSNKARYRVEAFATEPLPNNTVVDNKMTDPVAVGQCIRRAVKRAGTKTKVAVVAVSGPTVITKVITMSAELDDEELEGMIRYNADQYIPYELEDVCLDFNVLGPSLGSPELVDVLLAACRREHVDDRVKALSQAGLTASIVDVEAYAMEKACHLILAEHGASHLELPVAVADVGASTMRLSVLHQDQIIYTREQNFGGLQLINEVQQHSGLPREQIVRAILNGEISEHDEAEVLSPANDVLAQQIGRALQFFYSGSSFRQVDRVILAGSAAGLRGIDELIAKRLDLPIMVANPFSSMSLAPHIKARELMREAPTMMVAVGLALRAFD